MTDQPVTSQLRHVAPSDVETPEGVAEAANAIIDALNQLLPGRGPLVITDDARIMRRPASVEMLDAMAESTGRDENVPAPSPKEPT